MGDDSRRTTWRGVRAGGEALSLALAGLLANGTPAAAQHVMAQVVPLVTRADPTVGGRVLTEGYLTQPVIMADARTRSGLLGARLMLDFEALTLQRGELNTGGYGEGYIDRRHPHTYLHEAVLSAYASRRVAGRALDASLSVGRGFAPFGSDDPMVRTFIKYPVNHHLAQVLERVVAIGAARWGRVMLEGGVFNGDEPAGAGEWPRWRRFGDSWSGRATIFPVGGVELAASLARVHSPEDASGGGLSQRKRSVVARWERERPGGAGIAHGRDYLLAEWAHTGEWSGGARAFSFASWLVEGVVERRPGTVALRWERTDRPEEERLEDPFRSPRPHHDLSNLGITRWTTVTLHVAPGVPQLRALRVHPFAEVGRIGVEHGPVPGVFVPRGFYGTDRMWMLSAGARIVVGGLHRRMGRYGIASPGVRAAAPEQPHPHHHEDS